MFIFSEAALWKWEIAVRQRPNNHCQELLEPAKVTIKEVHDSGEIGICTQTGYITVVLNSAYLK